MLCSAPAWNTDPVHGEKVAHSKTGLGSWTWIARSLRSHEEPSSDFKPRKRGHEDSSSLSSCEHSPGRNLTARKIPFIYFFSGNSAASVPVSTFMCL
jgi:hypothetical protein